jgi:hypothetical protein
LIPATDVSVCNAIFLAFKSIEIISMSYVCSA